MDRIDIDIVDGSHKGNVYLSKKVRPVSATGFATAVLSRLIVVLAGVAVGGGKQNIKGETRLAITTHEMADVGVCLKHSLEPCRCDVVP